MKWDKIDKEQVEKLYYEGISIEKIAIELNLKPSYLSIYISKNLVERKKHIRKMGINHNNAVLTEDDVLMIYDLWIENSTYKEIVQRIGKKFALNNIYFIVTGKVWRELFEQNKERLKSHKRKRRGRVSQISTKIRKNEVINYPISLCPQCGKPYPCEHTA